MFKKLNLFKCIFLYLGSRLALMQVKCAMFHTLLHFKIEPNENTQIPIRMAKTLAGVATEKGVNLQFKLR